MAQRAEPALKRILRHLKNLTFQLLYVIFLKPYRKAGAPCAPAHILVRRRSHPFTPMKKRRYHPFSGNDKIGPSRDRHLTFLAGLRD
jgi:hypothetical protein